MQSIKQLRTKIAKPGDAKYFATTNRGENYEIKNDLKSERKDKRMEAIKKVIAHMTVGKDVSYAKTQPDAAIMAVNTFVKDCEDPNPLIRALAIRTMGVIQVQQMSNYLTDPLRQCLEDKDPYVRKTAALCVVKLFTLDSTSATEGGFLEHLKKLLSDSNAMVLANTVAALTEIINLSACDGVLELLKLDSPIVMKLLTALNECTEWGQVFILDAISTYEPTDAIEAQNIIDRIAPRLAHANAAVVLSSVKVILKLVEMTKQPESVLARIKAPLVTLLSSEAEIQYVTLRIVSLIVQKWNLLQKEVKVFFVKYNDPIYVKVEKLDIMIHLTNSDNVDQVLSELKEYSNEVDVVFVRKSVRAIGRCAIKIENSADRCVKTLISLIQTKVNYVVQEAVVVIKDIFRKYPNQYEQIISDLCDNLESLDEPEARASMIWIVGEYAERIDNAHEILESFLGGFRDENAQVQLQLLTAIVKLFLKRPSDTQELVQSVLGLATQESDNPDLRDRGYIYWRLLSADPVTAKSVVLAEKPLISEETDMLEPNLLATLLDNIPNLSSVCHLPPSSFVDRRLGDFVHHLTGQNAGAGSASGDVLGVRNTAAPTVIPTQEVLIDDLLHIEDNNTYQARASQHYGGAPMANETPDLLGYGLDDLIPSADGQASPQSVPVESNVSTVDALVDIFGDLNPSQGNTKVGSDFYEASPTVWLDPTRGKGLEVRGTFTRYPSSSQVTMKLIVTNHALKPMTNFAIMFNKNSFGLTLPQSLPIQEPLLPRQSVTISLPLSTTGPVEKMDPLMNLQIAMRNNIDVFYFTAMVPLHVLLVEDGEIEKRIFLATWKDIPDVKEQQFILKRINLGADACSQRLQNNNIFTVAKRHVDGQDMHYLSMKTTNGIWILAELKFQPNSPDFTLAVKSRSDEVCQPVFAAFEEILRS